MVEYMTQEQVEQVSVQALVDISSTHSYRGASSIETGE